MASDLQKWMQLGRELGYKKEELSSFVKEQQDYWREQREIERTEREKEVERAEKQKELDRQEKEKEFERAEKEFERAEKQKELDRQEKEKDRQEKEKENERIERQNEADRQAQKEEREAKLAAIKIEAEKEIKLKELQIRQDYDARQHSVEVEMNMVKEKKTDIQYMTRHMKLPNFREDQDCLDAYLLRFERTCEAYSVPRNMWALTLAKFLEGKALQVYERLSSEEAADYETLKASLFKRFKLTENGYRRKFKDSRMEPNELPNQFLERIKRYLGEWQEMACLDKTYDGLRTLILKDQFFVACSPDLRTFLKEKGKLSLEELLAHADAYMEAHPKELNKEKSSSKENYGDSRFEDTSRFGNDRNKQNDGRNDKDGKGMQATKGNFGRGRNDTSRTE